MTLSPGAKVHPNRSTLLSLAGLSAACSSMFKERAPTPPRFIGQSTWMSRIGSSPKRLGIRVFTNSPVGDCPSVDTLAYRRPQSRSGTLRDAYVVIFGLSPSSTSPIENPALQPDGLYRILMIAHHPGRGRLV